MTKAKFQIGDHVELISGGPTMTVNKIVYDNKESLKEEIKDLNLDLPLESYFTIDFDDIYLKRASVSSSLPKWLKDYLITCFVTAQQQILEDVHK